MKKQDNTLYVFLHVKKCAGSTLMKHILKNFKKNEVLLVYGNYPPYLRSDREFKNYINNLSKKRRDKIKVILGHRVYFGLHELFPNKEVKYITFLRNPIDGVISNYNFGRMRIYLSKAPKRVLNRLKKSHMRNGKLLDFKSWFLNNLDIQNFLFKVLFVCLLNKKFGTRKISLNKDTLIKIKKVLDKFYFIGLIENPEDFLFVYHKLRINKFFPNAHVSKKYFGLGGDKKIKKLVLSRNRYDMELYNYALKLNKKFRKENLNFLVIVTYMRLKKFFGHFINNDKRKC